MPYTPLRWDFLLRTDAKRVNGDKENPLIILDRGFQLEIEPPAATGIAPRALRGKAGGGKGTGEAIVCERPKKDG